MKPAVGQLLPSKINLAPAGAPTRSEPEEDDMEIERCRNEDCKRAFSVDEVGGAMPGSNEPEDIRCPHCGHTYTQRSNGYFTTHPLSSKAEEEYDRAHQA